MSGITDPIADMLTRIRNAKMVGHPNVQIPASNIKLAIARVMKTEGYIKDYEVLRREPHKLIRLHLMYDPQGESVIRGLQRMSKPGLRSYVSKTYSPRFRNGLGITILSTSQGVMAGREARRRGIGGEVVCHLW